jgi:hypothetical protein
MQQKYWYLLCEFRFSCFYLAAYKRGTERFDNWIGIFLAVASSTSIAAWAVWQSYPIVWAGIIALSQVVQAVRPFLPDRKLLQRIHTLQNEVEKLAIQVEFDWHQVANGSLTEEEINDKVRIARLAFLDVQVRCFEESTLPEKEKYTAIAKDKARAYLESNYLSRGNNG